jgi:hypothetical protein
VCSVVHKTISELERTILTTLFLAGAKNTNTRVDLQEVLLHFEFDNILAAGCLSSSTGSLTCCSSMRRSSHWPVVRVEDEVVVAHHRGGVDERRTELCSKLCPWKPLCYFPLICRPSLSVSNASGPGLTVLNDLGYDSTHISLTKQKIGMTLFLLPNMERSHSVLKNGMELLHSHHSPTKCTITGCHTLVPKEANQSFHTCVQDVQITRTINSKVNNSQCYDYSNSEYISYKMTIGSEKDYRSSSITALF